MRPKRPISIKRFSKSLIEKCKTEPQGITLQLATVRQTDNGKWWWGRGERNVLSWLLVSRWARPFWKAASHCSAMIHARAHQRPSSLAPRYKSAHQPIRRHEWGCPLQHSCSSGEQGPAWGPPLGKSASKMWWTHGGIMASKCGPILILETCVGKFLRQKGLGECDKVKDLEMRRLSWTAHSPRRGEAEGSESQRDMQWPKQRWHDVFGDVQRATAKGHKKPLETEKGKKMESHLRVSRRNQTDWHFDFRPVKPTSGFCPLEL